MFKIKFQKANKNPIILSDLTKLLYYTKDTGEMT